MFSQGSGQETPSCEKNFRKFDARFGSGVGFEIWRAFCNPDKRMKLALGGGGIVFSSEQFRLVLETQ